MLPTAYKKIVCEICGKIAEVPTRRRLRYCDDPNCIEEMRKRQKTEHAKRYYENSKKINKKVEARMNAISAKPFARKPIEEKKEERIVNTTAWERVEIGDLREISRELGDIRYRLIQMLAKEKEKIVTEGNKDKDMLIHSFEFDELTPDQVWQMYLATKEKRTDRRQSKYRYTLIKALLDSISIKAPERFIVTAIKGCKDTRNFDEYVEELRKDEELFGK